MRTQHTNFDCGVLSVINAAKALGVKITERSVRPHTGTTKKHGTSHFGVLQALERVGLVGVELNVTKDQAYESLVDKLKQGFPIILSVEDSKHWVVAFALIGDSIVTFDSWKSKLNKARNGLDIWHKKSNFFRWWSAGENGLHYGIIVKKGQ